MIGEIGNIIVIDSLPCTEIKTYNGKTLYEDHIKQPILAYGRQIEHNYFYAESKSDFFNALQYCVTNAEYMNSGILIHLEIHGEENEKGLVLADSSLVVWSEFIDYFRSINIACFNKLFITMATCYGRSMYLGVNLNEKSPYSSYISASQKVSTENSYLNFSALFDEVVLKGNLIKAYLETQNKETKFYYKDSETTFESAFKSMKDKLTNDKVFRAVNLKKAIDDTQNQTGTLSSEEEAQNILNKAIKDTYSKLKKSYDFGNNEG